MPSTPASLLEKNRFLNEVWARYRAAPAMEPFVELAVSINSFTEFLRSQNEAGLAHASHELEQAVLALFKADTPHPLPPELVADLDARIAALGEMVRSRVEAASGLPDRRQEPGPAPVFVAAAGRVWLLSRTPARWEGLAEQLGHFGMPTAFAGWEGPLPQEPAPLLLADLRGEPLSGWQHRVRALRARYPGGQIVCLDVRSDFDELHALLSGGANACLLEGTPLHRLVERIMEFNQRQEAEAGRVLIVEDSRTAGHQIRRTLAENGIECRIVSDPRLALAALREFNPDLVLMDMHMPGCTGVELTRIIRQHPEFLSVPIVYLSGETNVALQVDAMRLGGDHFLTKPFNPVFLNAVVRTQIDRYRALRKTMYHDSLTGLLNHTSGKNTLDMLLSNLGAKAVPVSVVMMDIDHFKQVNDTYGHPVGDQVIRALAWLLRQRLRRGDMICRYGGEEFLIALPHTTPAQAHGIIDRIREDFARIRHPWQGDFFQTTASAGIAGFPRHATSEAVIQAADAALYQAKRKGRNCVCLAPG